MVDIEYPVECEEGSYCVRDAHYMIVAVGGDPGEYSDVVAKIRARRISAALNACRDISTEDLEGIGGEELPFKRNWRLRQAFQDLLFASSDETEG